ncbi:MAG: tRNA (N6-threonylcarbamoyladenosine(37)-N6)-methyltransferase TrmO [Fibrobacter sp.]|nr:tRNA (N6-threonylcarbamoyladenosine(37)-N6)-methyltransferase TrmO [Fibrobacter sp.]MDD5944087.1 tRNA (N6-threonylcarbamoyladenosine(37)-N6)-methyltransferase TrmO [Fibrobacter sp.]
MQSFNEITFKVIARIRSDFPDKFGIPRQSGLLKNLRSTIVFEPEFKNADALRGLEGFSHLWLLWIFSENVRDTWKPMVRPPRLGGNTRLGVFATRSSFRPNPLAMSCVKIEKVNLTGEGAPSITVSGADLMDGTPIVDIKPYLPYADSVPEATGGFAEAVRFNKLEVEFATNAQAVLDGTGFAPGKLAPELLEGTEFAPENLAPELLDGTELAPDAADIPEVSGAAGVKFPAEKKAALVELLSEDPRPAYQRSADRIYGIRFAGFEIKFQVQGDHLTVVAILPLQA